MSPRLAALLLACIVLATPLAQAGKLVVYTRADIKGNDLTCGQTDFNGAAQNFCKICSSDLAVAEAACRANKKCKAFSYDGYCGYLKSVATPTVYREGFYVALPA